MAEKSIAIDIEVNGGKAIKTLGQLEDETKKFNEQLKKVSDTPMSLDDKMKKLKSEIDGGGLSMRDLSKKIQEYQTIALEAGRTSPIGRQAIKEAAQLQDKVTDLRNEVTRLSKDGQAMQGALAIGSTVTAGYGAMQGVMALAGQENEALMKSLVKMQAAQSVLMGIESIRASLEKESVLVTTMKNVQTKILTASTWLYSTAVGASTGALKIFKLALAATGIGALIVGIGLLIANFESVSKWVLSVSKTIADIFKPQIDMVIKALQFLGLVDSDETKKAKANAQAKTKAIEQETQKIIDALNKQSEANKKATDLAVENIDYEIRKRQAAGEETKKLEREKIMILIESTKKELALIDERIAAKQKEIEQASAFGQALLDVDMQGYSEQKAEQKKHLNSLIQDLEIFDIGERKRAMDEIARKKTTSDKKIKIVKEEISEEEKLRIALAEREAKRILDQIAAEEKATDEYNKRQLDARQTELQALTDRYFAEQEAFRENKEMLALIEEEFLINEAALKKKYADEDADKKKKADEEELERKIQNIDNVNNAAQQGADFLSNLNSLLSKDSEKNAKREFQINKTKDLAGAVTNTAKGVTQALASSPPPLSFIQAAGIGILGGANIARIASARYGGGASGGGGSVSIPNTASGVGGADVGAVTNTTTSIGGDSKVFVVEQDITNTQNKVQTLENQSKL
jgi:hypothetical protein